MGEECFKQKNAVCTVVHLTGMREGMESSSAEKELEKYLREQFGYSGAPSALPLRDLKILLKRKKLKAKERKEACQQLKKYSADLQKSVLLQQQQTEKLIQSQKAPVIPLAAIEKRGDDTGGDTDGITAYPMKTARIFIRNDFKRRPLLCRRERSRKLPDRAGACSRIRK